MGLRESPVAPKPRFACSISRNHVETVMSESRDYLEISFKSIEMFASNGRLEAHELEQLHALAMRDGVLDVNEVRVLKAVIDRIQPHELDDAMKATLAEISQKLR